MSKYGEINITDEEREARYIIQQQQDRLVKLVEVRKKIVEWAENASRLQRDKDGRREYDAIREEKKRLTYLWYDDGLIRRDTSVNIQSAFPEHLKVI